MKIYGFQQGGEQKGQPTKAEQEKIKKAQDLLTGTGLEITAMNIKQGTISKEDIALVQEVLGQGKLPITGTLDKDTLALFEEYYKNQSNGIGV